MPENQEDPPSMTARPKQDERQFVRDNFAQPEKDNKKAKGLLVWVKSIFKSDPDPTLRETIEEYIEDQDDQESEDSLTQHERELFSNLLKLVDMRATDVMVPRADIFALDINISQKELYETLKGKKHSRIPVYEGTLDEVIGTVHLKDLLANIAENKKITIKDMVTDLPIVAPSMSVLDLLLEMRRNKRHMVLVVDEYGGIDGLVTIGDIIEAIVGEIEDEHDVPEEIDRITEREDGSILVDGRLDIDEFEDKFGSLLSDSEKEESDTMGGLVSALAGRVPVRGEVLTHNTGMVFEVMDADPRRIHRLKIRNIPNTF